MWWKTMHCTNFIRILVWRRVHCTRVFLALYLRGNRSQLPSSFYIFPISRWFITDEWSSWEDFNLKNRHLMSLFATTVISLVQSFRIYEMQVYIISVHSSIPRCLDLEKESEIVTCVRVFTTKRSLPLNFTGHIAFYLSASLQLICVLHQCSTDG